MLKGLAGVTTHDHREWIPVLENDQDMARLARRVRDTLREHPACHGFLLERHGLYTWGATVPEAVRHVEILTLDFPSSHAHHPRAIILMRGDPCTNYMMPTPFCEFRASVS